MITFAKFSATRKKQIELGKFQNALIYYYLWSIFYKNG